jgi:hypothetical protein
MSKSYQESVDNIQIDTADSMNFPDITSQHLSLISSLDQRQKQISCLFMRHIAQEQRNSLQTKLSFTVGNQIAAVLDPSYNFIVERQIELRAKVLATLAYQEALQQIQDQESLYLLRLRNMTNRADTTAFKDQLALNDNIEHDTSIDEDKEIDTNRNTRSPRDPIHSFPSRLHEILSNPNYNEYITWLPHGRAWKIVRRKLFECYVIPHHFRHGRYSSFMRQVRVCGGIEP